MNTLVPLEYYTTAFFCLLLFVSLLVFLDSSTRPIDEDENLKVKNVFGRVFLIVIILYMGLRPISGKYFIDMRTYADRFEQYASGEKVDTSAEAKDMYFNFFMKFSSLVMSIETFFLLCVLLYVLPVYFASRNMFGEYWFYAFLMIVATSSFWAYGTNGIRNGIATSLFLLAVSQKKKTVVYLLFILIALVHKSTLVPIAAYLISSRYKNTTTYVVIWLTALPLSFALGSFWENFFLNLGLVDDVRVKEYFDQGIMDGSVEIAAPVVAFRWDFLLYSSIGVFAGWYFIIKRKFEDPLYIHLVNVYLLANTFWVLVIRVNFSNRFAYLSWFLLGVIIIYPMLKNRFFDRHHLVVGRIEMAYCIFMFVIAVIMG